MTMQKIVRWLLRNLQVDRSLVYVLASRLWQGVSGPITIWFIVSNLTEDQQGIYYGVFSFVALQAFFELGLLNILVGYAGHEAEALHGGLSETTLPARKAQAFQRMSSLVKASQRWFACASVLFAVVAIAFGWHTLSETELAAPVAWQMPFLIVVACAALTVYFAPRLAILEGAGFRQSVYAYRLLQALTGSLAVWAALGLGWGLWCLVAAAAAQLYWAWYVSHVRYRGFFGQFASSEATSAGLAWAQEIVPAQWRMALISVVHHLATQCFCIIILFFHHDAAEAGRLGMTLTATTAIQMLALAWVQTKFPVAASLHGAGDREQAGTMFRQAALVSSLLLIAAFAVLIGLVSGLPSLDARFANRFIPPLYILILGVGCLANHLLATQGFYILARRFNPLLIVVPGMLVAVLAIWGGGWAYSTAGVVIAYAVSMSLVVLPLHTWAYLALRRAGDAGDLPAEVSAKA